MNGREGLRKDHTGIHFSLLTITTAYTLRSYSIVHSFLKEVTSKVNKT